jgi:type I restriction enzyme S subunit
MAAFAVAALRDARQRGVLAAVASTTTVAHLGAKRFASVKIVAPPIKVQEEAVNRLMRFDDAVDALERRRLVLSNMRRALCSQLLPA